MAKITFLGTGNAFIQPTPLPHGGIDCAWHSNLLLETDSGRNILLDCGGYCPLACTELGIVPADIDGVYISHLDADHIGGLQWLAYMRYFGKQVKPTLYISRSILSGLRNSVEPMMREVEGEIKMLEDYFDVQPIDSGLCLFDFEVDSAHSLQAELAPVVHGPGAVTKWSYGLHFPCRPATGENVFWTSDAVFDLDNESLVEGYKGADIILQDCELGFKTGVHAHLDELRTLDPTVKRKMWLYHHDPAQIPEDVANSGEFAGFAQKGQIIEF